MPASHWNPTPLPGYGAPIRSTLATVTNLSHYLRTDAINKVLATFPGAAISFEPNRVGRYMADPRACQIPEDRRSL